MIIDDQNFIAYLIKNEKKEIYSTPRGSNFSIRLSSAEHPTSRLSFNIEFCSERWEKNLSCPPNTTMEFLDVYNAGCREKSDFKRRTGAQSPSRRGGYLLQIFKKIEDSLS